MAISPISNNTTDPAPSAIKPDANFNINDTVKPAAPNVIKTAPPPVAEIKNVASTLNRLAQTASAGVSFQHDESTGKTVIKVMDTETGDVIRQIPGEEALALSRAIDAQQGILLKTES